jgi:hypothetical protein
MVSMKTVLFAVLMSAATASWAQPLPAVHGTSVSGHPIALPEQAAGKVAVLIVGFSRGSSVPVGEWATRLKADYGRNPNVVIFRLPFLEEVPRMFRGLAMSGVVKSAGSDDRDTVVPVFEAEAAFKRVVKYSNSNAAYILVVDRTGEIRQLSSGDLQSSYGRVRDSVNGLLGQALNPAVP